MATSNNFTIIRLILAMMVIYSHSYAVTGHPEPTMLGRSFGNLAVHGFFVLSGFLITESYLRSGDLQSFAIKRFFRIIPALVPAHFFAAFLFNYFAGYASNPYPGLKNGPLWTLPWEGLMYTSIGIFGVLQILDRKIITSCLALGMLLVFTKIGTRNDSVEIIAPLMLLFVTGSFIRLSQDYLNLRKFGIASAVVLALLFMPVLSDHAWKILHRLPWAWGPSLDFYQFRFFPYILAFSFFMIFLARHFFYSIKIDVDLSYGVYIFGWPIQQSAVAIIKSHGFSLHPLLLFAISVFLTTVIAAASWFFVERPMIQLGHRLVSKTKHGDKSISHSINIAPREIISHECPHT